MAMFVKANGIVQHYVAEGSKGKPALVFANSLGSDLRIWDGVVTYLADDFEIIRYDKRGHGLTGVPAPPYSLDDFVLDLVRLLDSLEIKEAIVCGLSVGGVIAQGLAISYPDRVRALVLCDTGMRIGSLASWEERIATVKESGLTKLVTPSIERWFAAAFREHRTIEMEGYANMLLRISADGYLGTCYALRDADLREKTPSINKPTLVLCGDQDIATPPDLGRELAGAISGARFSLIKDAAHLACIEQPKAMAQQMREFFRDVRIV
ncbi:MAG TPA: 3-oxoadipate enol-lactonase [Candidatus Binatia bacterium]|nr:3-oxoadipate enol-lactonase [Candidatus Binatia bacterium]